MSKNILLPALLLSFSVFASCEKKAQPAYDPCIGQPKPADRNLDIAGFVVRDSNGQNLLLTNSAHKSDLNKLTVFQPCTDILSKAEDREQNGILSLTINGSLPCGTLYLKWNDTDIDTLKYMIIAETGECYCTYLVDTAHLMFNGKRVQKDTTFIGRGNIYTLIK